MSERRQEELKEIPDPGRGTLPRYGRRPLPPYRFVPGVHPHPTREVRGHSFESTPKLRRHAPWEEEEWPRLQDWLDGVDLFNRFFFWEAHEAWEGLWASAARGTGVSLLLQGLIQIAAALLKVHQGSVRGAATLSNQGLAKLRRSGARRGRLMGLDLASTADALEAYFAPLATGELPVLGPDVPVLRLPMDAHGRAKPNTRPAR
jgi:hypothetical protein